MTAMSKPVYLTEMGHQKAQLELETLLSFKRPKILNYLQDAKDGGDSADNTEYLFLIQELETIDKRIRDLKFKLEYAQFIHQVGHNESITLGNTVVIQENGASPETYTIVGSTEADPDQGCISNESPLGKALLNHRVGDEVAVDSPGGQLLFRIISVS